MRHEVHLHADIPILEGVSRRQIEQALMPLLDYLDADGLADVKSLEPDEPGFKFDEKELLFTRSEGVPRRQIGQALMPLLDYLDADGLADVKSLEPDEPGFKFDEKELLFTVCWAGE